MKLTHPASDQTVEVPEGSERPYLVNGWTVKAKKAAKSSGARAVGVTSDPNPERGQ